jgi:mannosyltransferase
MHSTPDVIIPNLHRRYSGVTAAHRAVAPRLARLCRAVWFGSDRPAGIEALGPGDLLRLRQSAAPIVWHARRNDEMIFGLILKALGWPFRLVFTSAAQRRHTAFTRWLIARMDAVIAASPAAAAFLDREAIIIPHGVDTGRYGPPADRDAAYAQTGLPGRFAIGCFGRVRAQKGTDVFVDAMCALLPRHPDFTALVIGGADNEAFVAQLKAKAAAAGLAARIRFLGELPVDEVPAWFSRLTIYAFTSRVEGFGLTLLEAMASGNAVVASRAGAAELLLGDGQGGVLVPPGDAAALAAALEPLMQNPALARDMGARARAKVEREFSLDAEVEKTAAVYRAVAARTAP